MCVSVVGRGKLLCGRPLVLGWESPSGDPGEASSPHQLDRNAFRVGLNLRAIF